MSIIAQDAPSPDELALAWRLFLSDWPVWEALADEEAFAQEVEDSLALPPVRKRTIDSAIWGQLRLLD